METITTSAPGKLMLFGEHAVIYGHPCIVAAVDQRIRVSTRFNGKDEVVIQAPQMGLDRYHKKISDLGKQEVPKPVRFIEVLLKNFHGQFVLEQGVEVTTKSDFSASYGFGSSAAVTVALASGLSKLKNIELTKRDLFKLCYKTVLDVQGLGSGFDIAAAIFGGVVYFFGGGEVIEELNVSSLPLVVGYTGIKADTPTLVRQVAEFRRKNVELVDNIFKYIEDMVKRARIALETSNWKRIGMLMTKDQMLLSQLGISSEELERLIEAAIEGGAYGAKLSGAGGGDCMIAVVDESKRGSVEQAIQEAKGEVVKVGLGAEGVRLELKDY